MAKDSVGNGILEINVPHGNMRIICPNADLCWCTCTLSYIHCTQTDLFISYGKASWCI